MEASRLGWFFLARKQAQKQSARRRGTSRATGRAEKRTSQRSRQQEHPHEPQHESLRYELIGLGLIAAAALAAVSLLTDRAGLVGAAFATAMRQLLGQAALVLPICIAAAGVVLLLRRSGLRFGVPSVGLSMIGLCLAAFLHVSVPRAEAWDAAFAGHGGGLIGAAIALTLEDFVGPPGRAVLLVALTVIGFVLVTRLSVGDLLQDMQESLADGWHGLVRRRGGEAAAETAVTVETEIEPEVAPSTRTRRQRARGREEEEAPDQRDGDDAPPLDVAPAPVIQVRTAPEPRQAPPAKARQAAADTAADAAAGTAEATVSGERAAEPGHYELPPLSLLRAGSGSRQVGREELMQRSQLLEQTLRSFGVEARVTEIHPGPAVTRYELQPAPGVRVSRITNLQQDLALALAAQQIRIEAPVPGKAAIGIEVPNREIDAVMLRDLLESPELQQAASPLTVALGRDIAGRPVAANLERMPHLLIAGATGSGKSVCINTIIMSLLLRARPDEVKLMLIDPKMVELNNYSGVPHLTAPVITDPKKAAGYLLGAVKEMERRYELFSQAGVRDIDRYNALIAEQSGRSAPPALPKQVIIIDELADLMMVAPVDVEDAIARLSAMARAAGLHLILATQRPSVDVITGVIKANIPSRIAFAVASQIDSRTILDAGGAERLLGRGDMLFLPVGAAKPVRVQGAYVSEAEIEAVVSYCRQQVEPVYEAEALAVSERETKDPGQDRPADALLGKAVWVVLEHGQASVSVLQRRLRISYNRAARLIDDMEAAGWIGPHQGSKPRDVLITSEDYYRLFGDESGADTKSAAGTADDA